MTDTFAVTTARPGQVLRVGAILAVASLPAVVFADAIPRAAALWSLAEGTRPYWVVSEALLLYGLVPLVVLSTIVLFLAPGLLLAIALGRGTSVPVWGLSAIPGSLLSTLLVLEVARRTLPATADALPIGLLMLASMGCCIGLAAIMANRRRLPWPMAGVGDAWPIAAAAVAVVALYLALSPKFLWENFNGDGAHAFEASRLLLHQGWPFFPTSAGPVAGFPGTTSMLFAFPNAWFIRLFGPIEAAVRLPWLVYLPLVVLGIQALAEEGGRRLERRTQLALWAGLLPFVFAMAFSASYSAYHADIALPGVQDTLLVVTLLGYCHAMVRREWLWAGVFALLSYLGLPNGFLLMGFWLLAELAVMRPLPWRVIAGGLSLLVGCILAAGAFGAMLAWTGQTPPGGEYGFSRTIVEVLRLDLTHWRRAVYLIVGGAGLPVAALFLWRRQDQTARRVTLLVLCYFAFFAVQARFSLHHLVPVMILPLVVAARIRPEAVGPSRGFHAAWYATALAMAWLSLPSEFTIATTARRVGRTITQQVGSYPTSEPTVFDAASLLSAALPQDWDPAVPATAYGGSPLAWLAYARSGAVDDSTVYLLRSRVSEGDSRGAPLAVDSTHRLDIVNAGEYALHQRLHPPTHAHAPIYAVPRESLFGLGGPHTIDVADRLRRLAERVGLRRPAGEDR